MSWFKEFFKGIIKENPVLVMLLGTCPTLALTSSASNAIGMGLATTFVLLGSSFVISLLKKVIPVAEECGVRMAIHPDDPPYPIFGLPRIITNEENLDRFLKIVDSKANSLCLCTGSLGCAKSNDVVKMVRKYAQMDRIAFMHIRNVFIMEDGSFEERAHLSSCGSLDIKEIVKALTDNNFDGYVRPDHGRMIWGETGKPGYGLFDRALGAAYINGLFEAMEKGE